MAEVIEFMDMLLSVLQGEANYDKLVEVSSAILCAEPTGSTENYRVMLDLMG